jgi:hypothetical protein
MQKWSQVGIPARIQQMRMFHSAQAPERDPLLVNHEPGMWYLKEVSEPLVL